jgi:hypothetical protein
MNKYISAVLFCLLIFFYFLFYGFYGYNDADDGFILASSWRIFNGAIPYKDFLLIRPPVTPFFHTLTFILIPENLQILYERFLFYAMLGISSLLGAMTLKKLSFLEVIRIDIFLLASIGFIYSVRNFPPMPWHTVDGVFFASIGIYILVRSSSVYSIIAGIFFLFTSAMCKQSFYLMPIAGIIFVMLAYRNHKKNVLAIFSLICLVSIFIFVLFKLDALPNFVKYTFASTSSKELIRVGLYRYWDLKSIYFVFPFIILLISLKIPYLVKYTKCLPYFIVPLYLLMPLVKYIYYKYTLVNFDEAYFRDDLAAILFIGSVLFVIRYYQNDKRWNGLIFLILLSWSAGISWGYSTPVFFSVPLVLVFFHISSFVFKLENIKRFVYFTFIIGFIVYLTAYNYPYCNPSRGNLKYELSEFYPKLNHIKVSKECYEKYKEFYLLEKKYGYNFKTLPGMPLSNYLSGTVAPVSPDWIFNIETINRNNIIIEDLEKKDVTVFLEKNPELIKVENSNGIYNSSVAYYVKSNWEKVDSTNYFEVYKKGK